MTINFILIYFFFSLLISLCVCVCMYVCYHQLKAKYDFEYDLKSRIRCILFGSLKHRSGLFFEIRYKFSSLLLRIIC